MNDEIKKRKRRAKAAAVVAVVTSLVAINMSIDGWHFGGPLSWVNWVLPFIPVIAGGYYWIQSVIIEDMVREAAEAQVG